MSSACLAVPGKNPYFAYPKHGVSDDADRVRRTVKRLHDESASTVTMSDRFRLASVVLSDGVLESRTDNWDGYGARALTRESLFHALRFVLLLPTSTRLPEVSVDPDGEVVLEWYKAPRQVFSITVGANGELVYAGLFGHNKANGTEFFEDEVPKAIVDNLKRVYS